MTLHSDLDLPINQEARSPAEFEETGLYLYAIVRLDGDANPASITSELVGELLAATGDSNLASSLQIHSHDGVAAAVAPVRIADFTEEAIRSQLADPAWLHEVVRRHHLVVQSLHQRFAVLPAKFGSVYATDDALREALAETRSDLVAQLERVTGCAEWAVHVYAEPDSLDELALSEDPALNELRAELEAAAPGRAYLLQRKIKEQRTEARRNLETKLAREVVANLRDHAAAYSVDAVGQASQTENVEIEVVRAAFLVHHDSTDAFLATTETIENQHEFWRLECTGPWPPYSFASFEQGS